MRLRLLILSSSLVVGASLVVGSPAHAEDAKQVCVDAHEQAQIHRKAAHFAAARRALTVCFQPTCPALVRQDCGPWLQSLDAEQPTVVVHARDAARQDAASVQVFDGDALVADRLDGRPLPLDPGPHVLRFVLTGGPTVTQQVLIQAGERARVLDVNFAAPSAPSEASPPSSPAAASRPSAANTVVAGVVGGVGVAALAAAVVLTVKQNSDAQQLHDECPSRCAPTSKLDDQISTTKQLRVLEGVSFGVAGAALGVASYFLLARPLRESAGVDVDASPHGAAVRWSTPF